MSHLPTRTLAALATGAVLALAPAGAQAATKKPKPATAKSVKALDTKLKKQDQQVKNLVAQIAKALGQASSAQGGVDGILGQVPQVFDGLTQLKDGLTQLKAGLTQAGEGLTGLKTYVTSDEYGFVQLVVGSTAIPGCFFQTADVPDNVQGAYLHGECQIPGSASPGDAIKLLAGVRSNEDDGTGATLPVASAGVTFYGQTAPSGAIAGGGGTVPAAAGQPPLIGIPLRSAMTSTTEQSFPFGPISTDKTVDLLGSQFLGTPASPVVAAAGNFVRFDVRFVDLSADPANPKA